MKFARFLLVGLLFVLPGCGTSNPSVTGTVTYDGQPLPEGNISFAPEGPGEGGGGPIVNGNYKVNAPLGKSKVQITASKMMPLPKGQTGMDGATEEVRQYIPENYNSKSELTADVSGADTINFDLKSK